MLEVPHVQVHCEAEGRCLAGVALELAEIQAEPLPAQAPSELKAQGAAEAYRRCVRFTEIIASWSAPVSVELHLLSHPSLDLQEAPGRIEVALRLTAAGPTPNKAIETCLSHYVALSMLLSLWKHAYFKPVRTEERFRKLFAAFIPYGALGIGRRKADIVLAEPYRLSGRGLGFQPAAPRPDSSSCVPHLFPWITGLDDWETMLAAFLNFPSPHRYIARLVTATDPSDHLAVLRSNLRAAEEFLAGGGCSDQIALAGQAQAIRRLCVERLARLMSYTLGMAVLLITPGEPDPSLASVVGQSLTQSAGSNEQTAFAGGFSLTPQDPAQAVNPFFVAEPEPYTPEEAACAFRLPIIAGDENFGLPVKRHRTARADLPAPEAAASVTALVRNRHRGAEQILRVSLEHRYKHVLLLGMTGTGKSTFMLNLLLEDARQGHGICLIDPHGDLADEFLFRFPEHRAQDLILVDFADPRRTVPMNFLRWSELEECDLILDDLYTTLDRVYDMHETGGPIFELYFRAILKLLMGSRPDQQPAFTLMELPVAFRDEEFRQYLVRRSGEPQLEDFLREAEAVRGEHSLINIAPYITSKFNRFLHDRLLRRIVGHGDMRLDFASIMNTNKVVIFKLGRGRFGAQAAALLMGLLLSRLRSAVMSRGNLEESARKPFFIYVDEIGSLAHDENFASLLAEARKYHVGLTLATQHASQLRSQRRSNDILSAALGNAGTVISFRVGAEDAALLEPIFAPRFTAQDLMQLPNFEGYIRFHLAGAAVPAASFVVDRPPPAGSREPAQQRAQVSARDWSVAPEECDRRIEKRRRFIAKLKGPRAHLAELENDFVSEDMED